MDDLLTRNRYRGRAADSEDNDMASTTPKSFRLALKRLRNRAGVTAKDAAKAIGKGESGYMRYEDTKDFDARPIPAPIILGLMPLFVGRGDPPIKQDELLAISEIANIHDVLAQSFRQTKPAVREFAEFAPVSNQLPIKFQIESGTFRAEDKVLGASYGVAPILPLRSYSQDAQWVAIVNDNSLEHLSIWPGVFLHCVSVEALPPEAIERGALVVGFSAKGDLIETVAGLLSEYEKSGLSTVRVGKSEIQVDVRGLAVYRYGPVNRRII